MAGLEVESIYSLVYGFLCFVFVVPPEEVVAAGFTIQNMFGKYLGDEQLDFTRYHTRRGSFTLFSHSLLPLGYYLVLVLANPSKFLYGIFDLPLYWRICVIGAIALPISTALCISVWCLKNWNYHPIITKLKHVVPGEDQAAPVISSINIEVRRPDRFHGGRYSQKVYVTESWIVKIGTYSIDVAHQSNCVISLHASQQYDLAESSPHGVQMLDIDVVPVNKNLKTFSIRLNAEHYAELKTMLQAPLVNARNVVVMQSVAEKFVKAFTDTVKRNETYKFDPIQAGHELESCIGCMQETASIKLVKKCSSAAEAQGGCQKCYCRPMWCASCMAKWFCNRQDQSDTSNWLACKATCPMCRATFCMADVCQVEVVQFRHYGIRDE